MSISIHNQQYNNYIFQLSIYQILNISTISIFLEQVQGQMVEIGKTNSKAQYMAKVSNWPAIIVLNYF